MKTHLLATLFTNNAAAVNETKIIKENTPFDQLSCTFI